MTSSSQYDDGRPIPNDTPPTAYELAALAISLIASGREEDEAFAVARKVFARAEEELLNFETLAERHDAENLELMPDVEAEMAIAAEPFHKGLGVLPPSPERFPLQYEFFIHGILPQRNAVERKSYFKKRVTVACHSRGKQIEDLTEWNLLVVATAKLRGWEDKEHLKSEAKKLHSRSRRGGQNYTLKRPRK